GVGHPAGPVCSRQRPGAGRGASAHRGGGTKTCPQAPTPATAGTALEPGRPGPQPDAPARSAGDQPLAAARSLGVAGAGISRLAGRAVEGSAALILAVNQASGS